MTLAEKLAKAIDRAENDPNYWRDIAITDFTRELHARMEAHKVSQGALARRMGTSRPYVTKLLSGSNFTLQTMVRLAMALDSVVRIRIEGNEVRSAEKHSESALSTHEGGAVIRLSEWVAKRTVEIVNPPSDSGDFSVRTGGG